MVLDMDELSPRLEVRERILGCTACALAAGCSSPVPFSGPTPASIVVLGEAPGGQEDETCAPFVGPAGKLIRKHLEEVGIDLETICFVNTVSCFPHDTPKEAHVIACRPNKLAQIRLANPTWMILLGKVAAQSFRPDLTISQIRGRPFIPAPLTGWGDPAVAPGPVAMATYHPAAALRNRLYETELRRDLERFEAMMASGDWRAHLGETCVACEELWIWLDPEGTPFCERHGPPELQARLAALQADYEAVSGGRSS